MKTLERQLQAAASHETSAIVVGSESGLHRHQRVLDRFPDVPRAVVETGCPPTVGSEEIVIVLGDSAADSLDLYHRCVALKAEGRVVVFGGEERGLSFEPPNWTSVDLHLGGMFYLAGQYLRGLRIAGSYVEFGVFDGRSFSMACHALRSVCSNFVAVDSFAGIVGSRDEEQILYQDGGYFANEETFWHNMRVAGVDDLPISTLAGSFQETLVNTTAPAHGIEPIVLAHIDVDVYEAAKLALNFLEPALVDGALLMFDEYHAFGGRNGLGERRALAEWLEENPGITVERYRDYTAFARSFIVHRSSKAPTTGRSG